MNTYPLFSIIVPTLNEQFYITPLLEALTKQTYSNFEVIIVDAHSTDKTVQTVKSYNASFPIIIEQTDAKNVSISRNLGAEKAKGMYLIFIDADNSIPENFLMMSKKYVVDGQYQAAIPKLTPSNHKLFDTILYKIVNVVISCMLITPRPFSTGSSMVVARDYFQKVKGFDSSVYIAEDHDIIRRLKNSGAKIKFMFDTYVIFSTRRFDQQGIKIYAQYIYSSLYLIFFSKIKKRIYEYQMGGENFTK